MRMGVITKSFAPDFGLCTALNRSVLDNSPDTVQHQIIVPRSDLELFSRLTGPRTRVRCEEDLLPRSFARFPLINMTVNLARPFPPIRGWILQQVLKLAAIAESNDNVSLVVDSDVEFIRPFTVETFSRDGNVRFFCKPNQIDERLPRHMTWHRVARALLGLPPANPPYSDYISSPLAWSPLIVRQMLAQVEATTGRSWPTALAGKLDFSECVLYGVFVEHVCGAQANSFASDDALCVSYWGHAPMDTDSATEFIRGARPTDIAAMIPSKSRTPPAVREAAIAALRAVPVTIPGPQGPAGTN
jgi:hypothetical protein